MRTAQVLMTFGFALAPAIAGADVWRGPSPQWAAADARGDTLDRAGLDVSEAPARRTDAGSEALLAIFGEPPDAWRYCLPTAGDLIERDFFYWDADTGTPPSGEFPDRLETIKLPDDPSSLRLALSAFATLGALRLLRKARGIQFSHVPEWYHSDVGPGVHHTLAFPWPLTALSPQLFAGPAEANQVFRRAPDRSTRSVRQWIAVAALPRGPPARQPN